MEQGKTYAWQITGHVATSTGEKDIKSPVYWFTLGGGTSVVDETIVRLEVVPVDVELETGDTLTFVANGYTQNENKITLKPEWSVIPQEGGVIDGNGSFTASQNVMSVAVIAKYGNLQEYSTVQITGGSSTWDANSFFNQVFGISTIN